MDINGINTAYRQYKELEGRAYELLKRDKIAAVNDLAPKVQDARAKYMDLINQSRDPQPWGDLFQIDELPRSELWQTAADYLAGKKINLFLDDDTLNYLGTAIIFDKNNATIQIAPNMSPGGKIHTLCHEAVHIRLGHRGGDHNRNEAEAIALANQWERFSEKNSYQVGNSKQYPAERQLRALLLLKF